MYTNEPWRDEQARQDAMEAYMSKFPCCEICGDSLMEEDCCVRIQHKWYCGGCAEVMSNSEMREAEGLD